MNKRQRPVRMAAAAAGLALVLGASACTRTGQDPGADPAAGRPGPSTGERAVLLSALRNLGSCDALLQEIRTEALARVTPYGLGAPPILFNASDTLSGGAVNAKGANPQPAAAQREGSATAAPAAAAPAGSADSAGGSPGGTSGTNNQEKGVDEADLVKVAGNRLIVVHSDELRVIDTSAATPTTVKTVRLPGQGGSGELFVEGDRAVVMANTPGAVAYPGVAEGDAAVTNGSVPRRSAPGGAAGTTGVSVAPGPIRPDTPTGQLIEVDLARGKVTRTLTFEGAYLAARDVDGSIRIVLSASPDRFGWVHPTSDKARAAALAANRAIIEASTIDQWLPSFTITEQGTTVRSGALVPCDRAYLPHDFAGFGSLVVLTVHLSQGLDVADATSVFTDAQTVYASPTTVAVATPRSPTYDTDGQVVSDPRTDGPAGYTTAVHTFDITDPDRATYQASGVVPGHLINQYALSERDGFLRAATTEASPWWGGSGASAAQSSVTVLERRGEALKVVGHLGGLGRGQQIQAVRFADDRAYVVTFRQTDPLYVIDLSDPAKPVELGQLELPGFSSYLHALEGGLLLGVGTDGTDRGTNGITVLSLFDVHDPTHPTRVAKLPLTPGATGSTGRPGLNGSSTPVATDARAFTYWQGRAVVPVSWWRTQRADAPYAGATNGSDAVVVSVGVDGRLDELGRIRHPQPRVCPDGYGYPGSGSSAGGGVAVPDATAAAGGKPIPIDDGGVQIPAGAAAGSSTASPGAVAGSVVAPAPGCVGPTPQITRSVVVGDRLFTLSDAGVQVNRFDTLKTVTWIPFR